MARGPAEVFIAVCVDLCSTILALIVVSLDNPVFPIAVLDGKAHRKSVESIAFRHHLISRLVGLGVGGEGEGRRCTVVFLEGRVKDQGWDRNVLAPPLSIAIREEDSHLLGPAMVAVV